MTGAGSGGPDDNDGQAGRLVNTLDMESVRRLNFDGTYIAHSLTGEGHDASEDGTGRGTPLTVYRKARSAGEDDSSPESWTEGDAAGTLDAGSNRTRTAHAVLDSGVRRLTPVETCRLQGFPDDWLGEPNEPPDSPRYAAMGDAVTVNVAEWLGARLRGVVAKS